VNEPNATKLKWSTREYQEGDEEQILELRGIALSGSKDRQWWKWCYLDGPAGPAISWLAEADKKIVGQYMVLPFRMKIGNETCTGSHSIDTMTHPSYQHKGIFTTLASKTYESAIKNGIGLIYGTPNEQSYPGFIRRLQWFDICEPPLLIKIIDWGNILRRRFKIPTFAGNLLGHAWESIINHSSPGGNAIINVEQILSFDERIDEFWLKASGTKNIMIIKNMKYLNWRYVDKPGSDYKIFIATRQEKIVGYIVLKLEKDIMTRGHIVDLLSLPHEDTVTEDLITKAIGYLQGEGATTVSCLMLPDTSFYRTLRKRGFIRRRSGFRLCARLIDPNLSKEFVANSHNWYYMWGDGDTI
jgi:GNAT superfamily N-acetyltransferase